MRWGFPKNQMTQKVFLKSSVEDVITKGYRSVR